MLKINKDYINPDNDSFDSFFDGLISSIELIGNGKMLVKFKSEESIELDIHNIPMTSTLCYDFETC